MTGSATPHIIGYVSCAQCGDPWVLRAIAARTGGLCPDKCWLASRGRTTITVRSGSVEFEAKRTGAGKNPPKKMTPRRRERIKTRDKARLAAMRRLAALHPIEFANLLAEERGARGLDPWTIDAALQAQLQETVTP